MMLKEGDTSRARSVIARRLAYMGEGPQWEFPELTPRPSVSIATSDVSPPLNVGPADKAQIVETWIADLQPRRSPSPAPRVQPPAPNVSGDSERPSHQPTPEPPVRLSAPVVTPPNSASDLFGAKTKSTASLQSKVSETSLSSCSSCSECLREINVNLSPHPGRGPDVTVSSVVPTTPAATDHHSTTDEFVTPDVPMTQPRLAPRLDKQSREHLPSQSASSTSIDRPRHSSSEVRCKQRRSSPEPSTQPPRPSPRRESRYDKGRRETPRDTGRVHHQPPDPRPPQPARHLRRDYSPPPSSRASTTAGHQRRERTPPHRRCGSEHAGDHRSKDQHGRDGHRRHKYN